MKILKTLILVASVTGSFAEARPQYFNELAAAVQSAAPGTQLPFRCNSCHGGVNPRALNLFGQDYRFVMSSPTPPDKRWPLLFQRDSNGNGASNLADFIAGKNPGVK